MNLVPPYGVTGKSNSLHHDSLKYSKSIFPPFKANIFQFHLSFTIDYESTQKSFLLLLQILKLYLSLKAKVNATFSTEFPCILYAYHSFVGSPGIVCFSFLYSPRCLPNSVGAQTGLILCCFFKCWSNL